jgi:hypothetical protein
VTVRVVEMLEMIDIHDDQGEFVRFALPEQDVQILFERAMVFKTRQA